MNFVENGVEFTNTYGDIDENFYASIENTYDNALDILDKNGILEKFKERAYKIVTDTEGIGWGLGLALAGIIIALVFFLNRKSIELK